MRADEGAITTEVVLLTPVLLLLLAFVVVTGRIGEASSTVGHAAQQGARAASLRADPDVAAAHAEEAVRANLDASGVACADLAVTVDVTRFRRGGDVAVTVACQASLGDVAFAGLPGSRAITATAVEVIDTYRGGD